MTERVSDTVLRRIGWAQMQQAPPDSAFRITVLLALLRGQLVHRVCFAWGDDDQADRATFQRALTCHGGLVVLAEGQQQALTGMVQRLLERTPAPVFPNLKRVEMRITARTTQWVMFDYADRRIAPYDG